MTTRNPLSFAITPIERDFLIEHLGWYPAQEMWRDYDQRELENIAVASGLLFRLREAKDAAQGGGEAEANSS